MAKGFDMLRIKSAVKSYSKMSLPRTHLTTMEFGQIIPLFCEELVPGDKFSVDGNFFSRMAPLVKPTYGKFSFRTVSGFVPYHQIADDAEAWLAGNEVWEGDTTKHRYFTVLEFVKVFQSANATTTSVTSSDYYDFKGTTNSGGTFYAKLTPLGRFYYKILTALGYTFPQNMSYQTSSSWFINESETHLSAYPLLAFAKLYNDYMSQSQRYNTSSLSAFLKKVKHGISTTGFDGSTGALSSPGILEILNGIRLCYENDYFTSAWRNPNAPLSTIESVSSMYVNNTDNHTPPDFMESLIDANSQDNFGYARTEIHNQGQPYQSISTSISQRMLDFLKSFDNWVRRNNYAGSRAVQKVYARMGIKTDDYRSNYAHIINTDILPVQVGDVTAMASSQDEALGDYAGKAIMNGSKGFSYDSNDYGMLFMLGYFTVTPMNAYGFDKTVLRSHPFDYYTPEFDGLGGEAISYGETFVNPMSPAETVPSSDSAVFGFTERYNSYRFGRDKITGEFRKMLNNADDNTWHTGRLLSDVRGSGNMVAQSPSMNQLSPIDSEYNRIFSVTSDVVDHFYLTCQFDVKAMRPMMSLNEVPRLGEGDTNVPRNGNEIN